MIFAEVCAGMVATSFALQGAGRSPITRPGIKTGYAGAVLDAFGRPQRADGSWDGHVFNLGHGISQFTPPEHVSALVEAVHAHSRTQRT